MKIFSFAVLISFAFFSCNQKEPLFKEISAEKSGIHFNNLINDNSALNVLNYEYIYNGGGVGIGDFNNDSLPDIYFTGNLVPNKLYLNKGNMQFEDITDKAGVNGMGRWCKGVSIADINNDGLLDIYVCAAVLPNENDRRNLLYINQGKNNNIPIFKEEANAYGLDDNSSTQMAAFFDYDNDGDLDVYLLNNDLDGTYPNEFRPIRKDGSWPNTDKLLRNNWNDTLKHAVFSDVSEEAGILIEGHGLGVNITDINNDGWKDIYVSNDYLSNNILYINNGNGTFTDKCRDYFKHTSKNAMGNDIADINNDGLPDLVELDMAPADNYRLKMMFNEINYQTFQSSARFGYMHQYARNTLQLNRGASIKEKDSTGEPAFSEVAYFAGIAQTDWSWAPLLIDADNDGYRDLMISNGLPKDVSDLDFMAYRSEAVASTPVEVMLKQLPSVKISNYIFRNNGDVTFADKSKEWGWGTPTFSSGMAYADFDRDGDIDVATNNTNMEATLLENTLNNNKQDENNYLQIKLSGDSLNVNATGSIIKLFYQGRQQVYEYSCYRGYLSSVENMAHFGLGNCSLIDSVIILWPGSKKQLLKNISANQTLYIKAPDAGEETKTNTSFVINNNWFTNITSDAGLKYAAGELDFIDFNIQRLLPHKLSQYGPSLAAGDVNGDGLDDIIVGGSSPSYSALFIQTAGHTFTRKFFTDTTELKYYDDAGVCLFDADNDNDLDVYIAGGGSENRPDDFLYKDHFYLNDGKGNFKEEKITLTPGNISKSCVKACDFDNDGDLDLFVGGRLLPGSFPKPVNSFIFRNDTKNGKISFTDVTKNIAPSLQTAGLVCDAVWSDADNDGFTDLVLTGEWMPVTVLKNQNGKFIPVKTSIDTETGWWNSITAADLDNDGDMDYVTGNFGNNSFIRASSKYPAKVYAKDFDNTGSFDAVFTSWIPANVKGAPEEFIVAGRDEFIKEMTIMKNRFPNYTSYANSPFKNVFNQAELKETLELSAVNFSTCWIENKGNMQMELHPLPFQAQWAPVYGMVIDDFNNDGYTDIVINGNEFSMAPALGRCDALNGLLLKGDGKGNFSALPATESGIFIPGNGKALAQLVTGNSQSIVASQNAGWLVFFKNKNSPGSFIRFNSDDKFALLTLKNGQKRKVECLWGSSFQSQSSSFIHLNPLTAFVEITNNKGIVRKINN